MQQKRFPSYLTVGVIVPISLMATSATSAILSSAAWLGFSQPAFSQSVSSFSWCNHPDCQRAQYYVGYNRTNAVRLQGKDSTLPVQPDTILVNTFDLAIKKSLPDIDERYIDREDSHFVSSIHRIEQAQVGSLRKSERMKVHSNLEDSSTTATVKLLWGDTVTVTSRILKRGTPVTVVIERTISGFGNPVTDNAFYQAHFKTLLNGQSLKDLDFSLKKDPGKGQKDQVSGKDKAVYTLRTKVGDTFTVESLMEVVDGVKVDATLYQILNGADAVQHNLKLVAAHLNVACLQSASGRWRSGQC